MLRPATQARLILSEATVLAINIDPALRNLDEALAGWPTSTAMAAPAEPGDTPDYTGHCKELVNEGDLAYICHKPRPCPDHDTHIKLTSPEAGAIRNDQARTDLERMTRAIREAQKHTRTATDIAHKWANPRIDGAAVQARLFAVDERIWCNNHALAGYHEVRRPGGTVCEWCAQWKADFRQYKCYPPKAILDIQATRRLTIPDVHRAMRNLKTSAADEKAAKEARDNNTANTRRKRLTG